jgi:hypothetical protein
VITEKAFNARHLSLSDSWITPPDIIAKVKAVLGNIDLDPASSDHANKTVGAKHYYDVDRDGLTRDWSECGKGLKVYVNPPGGRGKPVAFWKKLVTEYESLNVDEAIFMGFSLEVLQTSQGKGVPSVGHFPTCIPKKRIAFLGSGTSPTHANVIAYLGGFPERFAMIFREVGVITAGKWNL